MLTIEVGGADPPATAGVGRGLGAAGGEAREVAIGRGENRGRTVTYANVVRGMTRVGDWTGAPATSRCRSTTARHGEADGYVVLVQERRSGEAGRRSSAPRRAPACRAR